MSSTTGVHPKNNERKLDMAHRSILTQRHELMALPLGEPSIWRHYVLSDEDIIRIKQKKNQ